jgi:hypothetical protein
MLVRQASLQCGTKVNLAALSWQVLKKDGSGSFSTIIEGMRW